MVCGGSVGVNLGFSRYVRRSKSSKRSASCHSVMSSSDNYPSLIILIGAWSFSLTSWGKVSPKRMLAWIPLRFLNLAQSTRVRSTNHNSHNLLTGGPATHSSLRSSSILQVWWAKVKPKFGPLHVPKMVELWFLPFLD
jgi:hypothetical protein